MAPVTGVAEVDAALVELWPGIVRGRLTAIGGLIAVIAATGAFIAVAGPATGDMRAVIYPMILPLVLVPLILRRARIAHERAILPVLAKAAGMRFVKDAGAQRAILPHGLLPKIGREQAEDLLTCEVGGRRISTVEVKVESGGKNNVVYFDGLVVSVANLTEDGRFTLALEKETRKGFLSPARQDVEGLRVYGAYTRGDRAYGIWGPHMTVPRVEAIKAYLDRLFEIDSLVSPKDGLFSAVRTRETTSVAVRLKRDLYRIGGVFSNAGSVSKQISMTFEDLRLPLRIADKVIAAEAALVPATEDAAPVSPKASAAARSAG